MWTKKYIEPVWTDEFKHFSYTQQPLTQQEISQWRQQGYTHDAFTGEMYDSRNPMPAWCDDVAKEIGLSNTGYVFYRMKTNTVMPTHIDHFRRYCEVFGVQRSDVYRAVIFLEDWKPGHYFEIDRTCVANYRAGEYVLWDADVPHAASNIGIDLRYTLQITGTFSNS